MSVAEDVISRVKSDFAAEVADEVLTTIQDATDSPRLQRCIVVGANKDPELIKYNCVLVGQDYRDLIFFVEYDKNEKRIFDFNHPIPKAGLD